MPLTEDQQTAKDQILALPDTYILKGYAGTGKTYLLEEVKNSLEENFHSVVIIAPTHKALSVAQGDYTVHSYLGLKLARGKFGKYVNVQVDKNIKASSGDICIIDEASMISSELLNFLLDAQASADLKLIFVGDPAQLPPVGEDTSPVWQLDAPGFTLTKIMRQAEGSGIIALASLIRDNKLKKNSIQDISNNFPDVHTGSMKEMQEFYFQHTNSQLISHRNAVVDKMNAWARQVHLPNTTQPYEVGEEVYIRSYKNKQKHRIEDYVTITAIAPQELHYLSPIPMQIYQLTVESDKGEEQLIIPASPVDENVFNSAKKQLASQAKRTKSLWGAFWTFSESCTLLKHKYAMTSHRSQGSTFSSVVVNYPDITSNNMLYTAVTRAADQLFIIQ